MSLQEIAPLHCDIIEMNMHMHMYIACSKPQILCCSILLRQVHASVMQWIASESQGHKVIADSLGTNGMLSLNKSTITMTAQNELTIVHVHVLYMHVPAKQQLVTWSRHSIHVHDTCMSCTYVYRWFPLPCTCTSHLHWKHYTQKDSTVRGNTTRTHVHDYLAHSCSHVHIFWQVLCVVHKMCTQTMNLW